MFSDPLEIWITAGESPAPLVVQEAEATLFHCEVPENVLWTSRLQKSRERLNFVYVVELLL